jgi:DNA-binding NtrC family response regulator
MPAVLIVEDEAVIRILIESVLQSAGYQTLSAGTLAEAQALIHSDQKFDAVFTDVNLTDGLEGGLQVGQLTRQARPGTPVLYTSGKPLTDGMKELFVEPSEFLEKPYTDDQMIIALAGLIGQGEGRF